MALKDVGKQATSESMDSHGIGGLSGAKNDQPSSLKPGAPSMHSSGPGPSCGAAGGNSQDPNG